MAQRVGVLGASGLVGDVLLPRLLDAGWSVAAFSRSRGAEASGGGVCWRRLQPEAASTLDAEAAGAIPLWICVAPIAVLPDYFSLLEAAGARRVVALSSTSLFTKEQSSDADEQALARRLAEAEASLQAWAERQGVEWVVLRPTLIYRLGRDKNITEIARFIRRFGFFPVFGRALGLRQPIHAADLAEACVAALSSRAATNRAYNVSGAEVLTYRAMVTRVGEAIGRPPRLLTVPLWVFRFALVFLRCVPRYRYWSAAMAERMNCDLVFDHAEARRDLAFEPRGFAPGDDAAWRD
ncbi:MAG: NAD-dependent epimerase/dehydratase family protein [Methylomicrobium sp.]